jgi:flagellar hook-length control protein FliK
VNAGGSLQNVQDSRRDADGNAASAPLAVAQTGAAPVAAPAPPSPAAVAVPLNPAAQASESLQKPESPRAPTGPAGAVPAAEALPTPVAGPVQVAQMINRIGQSEMRIGMNTSAFGSVEVRTVVHANDVGLVIGSEKGDLRTLLSSDMPAITNTLQQQNLRLNSVNFMQGFAFSNNASGGGDSRQQSFVPMRTPSGGGLAEATVDDSLEVSAAGEFAGGGLSILA